MNNFAIVCCAKRNICTFPYTERDTSNLRKIRSAFSAESVSTHPPVYICPYFTVYIRCVYTSRASISTGTRGWLEIARNPRHYALRSSFSERLNLVSREPN